VRNVVLIVLAVVAVVVGVHVFSLYRPGQQEAPQDGLDVVPQAPLSMANQLEMMNTGTVQVEGDENIVTV